MSKIFNLAVTAAILLAPAITVAQPTYDINFTLNPPIIDGIVSPGEWDEAAAEQGGWRILRNPDGPIDAHNNRFRMMWDDTNLYILTESDYGEWTTNERDEYRGAANNVNIFFDPNLDGEGNQGEELAPFATPDAYQIAINQYMGTYSCEDSCSTDHNNNLNDPLVFGETGSDLSTFAAARSDAQFGNNLGWLGMRGTRIGTVNTSAGGVVEIAIPWSDFDATGLDTAGLDPGLNLNGAIPAAGDQWIFNIGQITTDSSNLLPVWSWHDNPSGNEFFASQPHGVVTFVMADVESFVPPETFSIFRGTPVSVELTDFLESDDTRAMFRPGFTIGVFEAPVWLIFDANSPTATSFTVESSAGTPGLTYTAEAFNWASSSYDVIGVSPEEFNMDTVMTFDIVAVDHINVGGEVRGRAGWRRTGFTINFPWEVRVDQVGWNQ